MGRLTSAEIQHLLECLSRIHGRGWSKDPAVGALQAKLSILLQLAGNDCTRIAMPDERDSSDDGVPGFHSLEGS